MKVRPPLVNGRSVLLVAAAAGLLLGCGGSSDPQPLAKPALIHRMESICQKVGEAKEQKINAASEQAQKSGTFLSLSEQKALVEDVVIPTYRKGIREFGELEPVAGERASMKRMVQKFEAAMKSLEANPVQGIGRNLFATADEAASKYGVTGCVL